MLAVKKFGGSSLAGDEGLSRAAAIIAKSAEAGENVVAVVSARGKETDELIHDAESVCASPPPRELDALVSLGENRSAALMAMNLRDMGIDSVSLSGRQAGIFTDTHHGDANIIKIDANRIVRELNAGRAVIVAGFQGADSIGDTTTLGRGGSDTTAVSLAAALEADRCEIYSDVDGVYTADPNIIPNAILLPEMDYEDMLLLSLHGSQVLHSRSVSAAMRSDTPVSLLSTFTGRRGTVLKHLERRPKLCGVTRDKKLNTISIVGSGVDDEALHSAVDALNSAGIEVLGTEIGDGVCSMRVAPEMLTEALKMIHRRFFE